jgi:hypothetical protein
MVLLQPKRIGDPLAIPTTARLVERAELEANTGDSEDVATSAGFKHGAP